MNAHNGELFVDDAEYEIQSFMTSWLNYGFFIRAWLYVIWSDLISLFK
jgi:hypothetical protein